MSIHWQQSRVHALNSSSSKFNYGFPKSPRFQSTSKSLYILIYSRCDSFYNISKSFGSKKGAGIGRGSKVTFEDRNGFPSPLQYDVQGSYENRNKNKGVKLSLGRENIKYGGIFSKSETPDPGHYNPKDSRLYSPKSGYSIRPKLKELDVSYIKNPGPGHCKFLLNSDKNLSTISATGIYSLSNLPNCSSYKMKPSKLYDSRANEKTPGPGQYDHRKENLSQTGQYFLSKYEGSRCRSFSRSSQNDTLGKSRTLQQPGPGAYNYYSEFGARNKVL